jgi:hypothetical protein
MSNPTSLRFPRWTGPEIAALLVANAFVLSQGVRSNNGLGKSYAMISQLIETRTTDQCRNKLHSTMKSEKKTREQQELTCADVVTGVLLVLRKTMASTASDDYPAFFDAVVVEVGTFGLSESEEKIRKMVRKVEKKRAQRAAEAADKTQQKKKPRRTVVDPAAPTPLEQWQAQAAIRMQEGLLRLGWISVGSSL